MAYLESSIPPIHCYLRKEFLYNLESHHGELEECILVAVTSRTNEALLFTCVLPNGAMFSHLPISAFRYKHVTDKDYTSVDWCELWDCFSYYFTVIRYQWAKNKRVRALMKDKSMLWGNYQFTIAWCAGELDNDTTYSELPSVKTAHILSLDNGLFVALPNNRVLWHDPDFCVRPVVQGGPVPDYKLLNQRFTCEGTSKWVTGDNDKFFYDLIAVDEKRT